MCNGPLATLFTPTSLYVENAEKEKICVQQVTAEEAKVLHEAILEQYWYQFYLGVPHHDPVTPSMPFTARTGRASLRPAPMLV